MRARCLPNIARGAELASARGREFNQALNDLVAACGSPPNALPPILRAQTAAASLAASLEVWSRLVAVSSPSSGISGVSEETDNPQAMESHQQIASK